MLSYGFFDYKYSPNMNGVEKEMFTTPHIVYIIAGIILTFVISILLRNIGKKKVDVYVKVMSIMTLLLEIVKITWESYWDIKTGRGFNWEGLLPIYTCSLYIYTLLVAAWTKGKARKIALSYITTISLLSGAIGIIYCNGLNYYPFWTFGAFYSLFFHLSMFFTGVFLLITGYYELEWKDIYLCEIPMIMLSVIAVPINYALDSDYMLLHDAGGVPFMQDLAPVMAEHHLRWLFSILMLAAYLIVSGAVVCVYKLVKWIINKTKRQEPVQADGQAE